MAWTSADERIGARQGNESARRGRLHNNTTGANHNVPLTGDLHER